MIFSQFIEVVNCDKWKYESTISSFIHLLIETLQVATSTSFEKVMCTQIYLEPLAHYLFYFIRHERSRTIFFLILVYSLIFYSCFQIIKLLSPHNDAKQTFACIFYGPIPMSSFSSWLFDHEDRDGPGQKFLLVLALLGNKTAFTFPGKERS